MEAAGGHVASADAAVSDAHAGLDAVSRHGEEVAALSRHIAEGTRQQSAAGSEIAQQVAGIVGGIAQTSSSIAEVTTKTLQMKETSSRLRQLITYFRFMRGTDRVLRCSNRD
jgi:aerotaxis receptor